MKKNWFLLFLIIYPLIGLAQENYYCYNLKVSLSYYFLKNEDISKSLKYTNEFLEYKKVHPRAHIIAAKVFLKVKDTIGCFEQLNYAFSKGVIVKQTLNKKPFSVLSNHELWKQYYYSDYKQCLSFTELSLIKEIDEIITNDQSFREYYYLKYIIKEATPDIDVSRNHLVFQDSINHVRLRKIILEYGYPSYEIIGYKRQEALNTIVLHIIAEIKNDSIWLFYKEAEIEAISKGSLQSYYLATHEDFYAHEEQGAEIYGSSTMFESKNDKLYSREIKNTKSLDRRRLQIGLIPLSYHLNKWSSIYKQPIYAPSEYTFNEKEWYEMYSDFCDCK